MIILWAIEELSVRWVKFVVVFGELDIEVLDPAKLTIDISLL